MYSPRVIKGKSHTDSRGILNYNNVFDASSIKRIYVIENISNKILRGWKGHKIEQRWFIAIQGSFRIKFMEIDNWISPSKNLIYKEINLTSKTLDVLHIPPGYATCIQSIEKNSKLLVMADYAIDEVEDEYRFDLNYFSNKIKN